MFCIKLNAYSQCVIPEGEVFGAASSPPRACAKSDLWSVNSGNALTTLYYIIYSVILSNSSYSGVVGW